ncbi:MAG: hypothetical protein M3Q44_05635 [bacterium]|nr:hypothetical protein [bacterium]
MVSCIPLGRRAFQLIIIGVLIFIFGSTQVQAADVDLGFATYVEMKDTNIEDGSIIITTQDGLYLSRYPYDNTLSGVAVLKPAIVLGLKRANNFPLSTKGTTPIRVSTVGGKIKKGDSLTSSIIPGVAMLASKSGMVVGTALADYQIDDTKAIGKIPVLIDIHYNEFGVTSSEYLTRASVISLRFILGAIVALVTTILCFVFFSKYTSRGIEAMGRNPLAAGAIKRNMYIQGGLFLVLVIAGYTIAFFLIRF